MLGKGGSKDSNLGLWPKWKVTSSTGKSHVQEATARFWYPGLGEEVQMVVSHRVVAGN